MDMCDICEWPTDGVRPIRDGGHLWWACRHCTTEIETAR